MQFHSFSMQIATLWFKTLDFIDGSKACSTATVQATSEDYSDDYIHVTTTSSSMPTCTRSLDSDSVCSSEQGGAGGAQSRRYIAEVKKPKGYISAFNFFIQNTRGDMLKLHPKLKVML